MDILVGELARPGVDEAEPGPLVDAGAAEAELVGEHTAGD